MKKWKFIRNVIVLVYTLSVTYMVGEWAIRFAFMTRGYSAVGGEYFLIPLVAWVAYKTINIFLDLLEEVSYAES